MSCAVPLGSHYVLTSRARVPLCRESTMRTMQEALQEAEKYAPRCEALAARMEEGKGVLEQARAEQAGRARVAAEAEAEAAAEAAEAVATAAAERLQMEQELSRMEQDRARMEQDRARMEHERAALALRMQEMQAQLGITPPAAPAVEEESVCVVCMDAPKQHVMVPCMHVCVCEACAQRLLDAQTPHCPVCRTPVRETARVFF